MKKLILALLLVLIGSTAFSQFQNPEERILFSQSLSEHLDDYNRKADLAYRFNDYKKGKQLFEEFTNNQLEGSFMDNFKFFNLRKKEVELYDFKRPVFLITYASWVVPGKGEVPAINELAKQYKGKIDFIVLFWDKQKTAKELAQQFSDDISIVYVDESENRGAYVIKNLKHSLGLPTCFLMDHEKRIMEIRRSVFPALDTDQETAYRENFIALETSINKNLIKEYDEVYAENISLE